MNTTTERLIRTTCLSVLMVLVVYVLIIAQDLLIPLVIAVILWYLLISIAEFIKHHLARFMNINYWLSIFLACLVVGTSFYLISIAVANSSNAIIAAAPDYSRRFMEMLNDIAHGLGRPELQPHLLFAQYNPTNLFPTLAIALSNLAGNTSLILIYIVFLLLEHDMFKYKLRLLSCDDQQYQNWLNLARRMGNNIQLYLRIKTLTSACTGLLTWLWMLIMGVDFAPFWGVMFFLLNFIPNVGSIVAVMSALFVVWMQFGEVSLLLGVGIPLTLLQFAIGNLLEPRLMGNSLNLSPLVILLSLVFWGSIWGILGMILCIPAMVILTIALAQYPKTQGLAVLLSSQGNITPLPYPQ